MKNVRKPVSFWKPMKIKPVKIKSNSLFSFKPVKPINLKSQFNSISPVNLKMYPTRTKSEWRMIDRKPFGDADRDKVPNIFDCRPLNKSLQGWKYKTPEEAKEAKRKYDFEYRTRYQQRPEVKEAMRKSQQKYSQRPEVKERLRGHFKKSVYLERRKKAMSMLLPEIIAHEQEIVRKIPQKIILSTPFPIIGNKTLNISPSVAHILYELSPEERQQIRQQTMDKSIQESIQKIKDEELKPNTSTSKPSVWKKILDKLKMDKKGTLGRGEEKRIKKVIQERLNRIEVEGKRQNQWETEVFNKRDKFKIDKEGTLGRRKKKQEKWEKENWPDEQSYERFNSLPENIKKEMGEVFRKSNLIKKNHPNKPLNLYTVDGGLSVEPPTIIEIVSEVPGFKVGEKFRKYSDKLSLIDAYAASKEGLKDTQIKVEPLFPREPDVVSKLKDYRAKEAVSRLFPNSGLIEPAEEQRLKETRDFLREENFGEVWSPKFKSTQKSTQYDKNAEIAERDAEIFKQDAEIAEKDAEILKLTWADAKARYPSLSENETYDIIHEPKLVEAKEPEVTEVKETSLKSDTPETKSSEEKSEPK